MNINKNVNVDSVNKIINYYEEVLNNNLLIVGLNDDRCFNLQKSCLTYLKELLKSDKYNIDIFNGFSMFFNKTRHIDYFLDNNLSLYEVKQIQKYATINEVKHALGESKIGEKLGKISSKLALSTYENRNDSKEFKISTSIENSKEPIIVYSSGINDIMSELWMNPFSVKNCYKKDKEAYEYSLDRTKGIKRVISMNRIMDGHKSNFEKILSLNNDSKIMVLSAYLYSKSKIYDFPFHDFVLEYNSKLEELCKEYNLKYVDLRFIEKTRYQGILHTYFKNVAKLITIKLIDSLSISIDNKNKEVNKKLEYNNKGSKGMLQDMIDYRLYLEKNEPSIYKLKEVELEREESVIQKVIKL